MKTQTIINAFDFDKVESRVHISELLNTVWDNLSSDDKFDLVQILWDGWAEYLQRHRDEVPADQIRAHEKKLTPEDGSKWDVDEDILRKYAGKILDALQRNYVIKGVNA